MFLTNPKFNSQSYVSASSHHDLQNMQIAQKNKIQFKNITNRLTRALKSAQFNESEIVVDLTQANDILVQTLKSEQADKLLDIDNQICDVALQCLNFPLKGEFMEILRKACSLLSNLAMLSRQSALYLVEHNILFLMKDLLTSESPLLLKLIFWILANLMSNNLDLTKLIDQNGFIDFVIDNEPVFERFKEIGVIVAWCATNFFRSGGNFNQMKSRKLLRLLWLQSLRTNDKEIREEIIHTIRYYLEHTKPDVVFVNNLNIFPVLQDMLRLNDPKSIQSVLKIYGKLSSGDSDIISNFLNSNFKAYILNMTKTTDNRLLADVLWIISNIVLTGAYESNFFFERDFIEFLQSKLTDDSTVARIKYECLQVVRAFFTMLKNQSKKALIFEMEIIDSILIAMSFMEKNTAKLGFEILDELLKFGKIIYNNK